MMEIRPVTDAHRGAVADILAREWGSPRSVTRGKMVDASVLPGFAMLENDVILGIALYQIEDYECELCSLYSVKEGEGVGSALLTKVERAAAQAGCHTLWLSTTNDNTHALRFYQKRGYVFGAVRVGAMADYRKVKPEIAEIGHDGIAIRDEIELVKSL